MSARIQGAREARPKSLVGNQAKRVRDQLLNVASRGQKMSCSLEGNLITQCFRFSKFSKNYVVSSTIARTN